MLRILGGARPVPNATADSSKAYTYLRGTPPEHRRCSVSLDFRFVNQGSRRAASQFRLAKSPPMSFFCSFLDHPDSHLDQVYDSPPAYFWCANPGVVEGTLAVMVGASCGAMPGSRKVSVLRSRSVLQHQTPPGDGSKGFILYVGSDSL